VDTIEEEEARLELHEAHLHGSNDSQGRQVAASGQDDDKMKGAWYAWMRIFFLKRMVSRLMLSPHERIELIHDSEARRAAGAAPSSFSRSIFSGSSTSALAFADVFDTMIDTNDEGKLVARQFRPKLFLINQVNNVLLLFTFGAASPLLSLVIVMAMIMHTIHLTLVIGRFVQNEAKSEMRGKRKSQFGGIDKSNRVGGIDQLNEECRGFKFHFLYKTRWLLLLLSSSFFAYFLMDTCGDKYGYNVALVPFLLMLLTPILIFILEYILACFGYQVSPEPMPLVFTKNRGVTDDGLELEPQTATLNPLSYTSTDEERAYHEEAEQEEEEHTDDIPARESTIDGAHTTTTSPFHKDITFIRPVTRRDSVGGANAATLYALDATRMSSL